MVNDLYYARIRKLNSKYGIEVKTDEFGWIFILENNSINPKSFISKQECIQYLDDSNYTYKIIENKYI